MKSISLYFKQGSSDKAYRANIEPQGSGYVVNFAYGRRGTTLKTGAKTSSPVSLAKAEEVFEGLVQEKKAKGYQEQEGATPYQHSEKRVSGILPQLLNPVDESDALIYINDDKACAQEKLDGRNILIRKTGNDVEGINKKGLVVGLPETVIVAANKIPHDFVIAGECVGDVLHAHDILDKDGQSLRGEIYGRRNAILATMLAMTSLRNGIDFAIRYVHTAWSRAEKSALFETLKARKAEGIVFKDVTAPFTPGRPASGGPQIKVKFYATLSAVVDSVNTKRSVNLKVKSKEPWWVAIGKCTVSPNFPMPKAGDVVEVRYLYAFKESNALYQTIFLGKRDDVEPGECTLEQIKYKPENDNE